jgi:sulfur carrier protein
MIELLVNSESHQYTQEVSLQKLLDDMSLKSQKGIAVAVNEMVIPKQDWENYVLNHQDKIIVIQATQGG